MAFIKAVVMLMFLLALTGFFYFELGQYFTFEFLKSRQSAFEAFYKDNALLTIALFFTVYVLSTALSFPGASLLSLLGGVLFGLFWGSIIVSLASTIGATLAFLVSRLLLRDFVENRFSTLLQTVNQGLEQEGIFYLFTMRLIPVFPFFVINLLMGVTSIRISTYFWVSLSGMLLGTIVYVNAGVQLAQLDSLADIFSFDLMFAFFLLGIFPWVAKYLLQKLHRLYLNGSGRQNKPVNDDEL